VIRANPAYSAAYIALAYLHLARNDRVAAIDNFQAALRIASDDPDGHYRVARLLDDAGRLSEAEIHYGKFLEQAPPTRETLRAWVEARVQVISSQSLQ
jgi:tetratricopeptide (TPR) repeat protein